MPPEDPPDPRRSLRRAPISGDVVNRSLARRDDDDLDEGPSAADLEKFGDVTRRCPHCGKDVFDDVDECYHCRRSLRTTRATPAWVFAVVLLLILALLGAYGSGFLRFGGP